MLHTSRRHGFTLIELLVVIAIIGILAAMLFPVFARARESARKVQCLSNVKNIAMAIQMYLADYDAFPPRETDAEAVSYAEANFPCFADAMNPYLRWPVILDEYIKNRDVWNCPSARMTGGAGWIVPGFYAGGWLGYLLNNPALWAPGFTYTPETAYTYPGGVCNYAFPSGWGGTITDSLAQQDFALGRNTGAPAEGAFKQAVACNENNLGGTKGSTIDDPSWYVVCGDGGAETSFMNPGLLAYPDVCFMMCVGPNCIEAYPDTCAGTDVCGAKDVYKTDPNARKSVARHMGGSNVGFADGHAKWMASESILAESPRYSCGCTGGSLVYGKLRGLTPKGPFGNGPTSAAGDAANGIPPGGNPNPLGCIGTPPLY